MEKERRKYVRVKDPTVSLAAYLKLPENKSIMFGKIHDLDPDGICVKFDKDIPSGQPLEFILRLFKKDIKFSGNVIRSNKEDDTNYIALLFDWDKTSESSKQYLEKYLLFRSNNDNRGSTD